VLVEDHHAHLTGALTIGGQTRPAGVEVDLEPAADGLHAHGVVQIRQTDFGIKPYTLLALRGTPNRRTTMSTRIGGDRAFT